MPEPSPLVPWQLDIGVYGARGIPSTYSGYETFLTELLPRLASRGHSVTMYCRQGEVPTSQTYEGVRLRHLPALRTKSLSTLTHGFLAAFAARLARHDVVLVVNVANALPVLLATLTGQPAVLNTDGQEWLRGKWGRVARNVFLSCARLAPRAATALISDCRGMADVYRRDFGANSSTVIPYMYLPSVMPSKDALWEVAGVKDGAYYVTGGRLVPENNIDRVVEAFMQTTCEQPLLVLGEANYDSPVRRRLSLLAQRDPRVRLLGHVSDRQHYISLLAHARRYVHAHSVGGINPSLVEAMGAGAAVLALDTVFNREALGPDGRFFSEFKTALPAALHAASQPWDDTRAARQAGRSRARSMFGPQQVVSAYESLLAAAAACPSTGSTALRTPWDVPAVQA